MCLLVVGLTPTIQRTMRFAALEIGAVNRAREVRVTASGKAVNVARVITLLGGEARLVQLLGGDTGRFIARTLDEEGVAHASVPIRGDAPTRTCATLLPDGGPATELVEEAQPVSEEDVAALEDAVLRHLPTARALCLSGSFPPGVPEDLYARLVRAARGADVPAFVDAQRAPLRAALAARPFLVKPNLTEAAATLDLSLSGEDETDARAAVDALTRAGAAWALVSLGRAGSLLGDGKGNLRRIEPPRIEAVNPIGSGDSLLAGLALAFVRGASLPEAAVFGTACAAANCLTPTSGVVFPEDVEALLPRVRAAELATYP